MLPRQIGLLCLLCVGLILNGVQFSIARKKKKMNNYELLVAHSSALKLICIIALLVLVILALNGHIATEPFGPSHPYFGAIWCTLSLSINHMLFVSIDRVLIIKIPINAFSAFLIMVSMFVTMVFMVNLLIAQLSNTYNEASETAEVDHDISKALFVSQLDNSRLYWWNPRLDYYTAGSYEHDMDKVKELFDKWESVNQGKKYDQS